MIPDSNKSRLRLVVFVLIVLSVVPLAFAAVSSGSGDSQPATALRQSAENVTFVSTQGGSVQVYEHGGKLVAIHTPTNRRIWIHDEYRRYMDVDPLDDSRVLFVAGEKEAVGGYRRKAVIVNWRTGTELLKFRVPGDTHDVDALGDDRFAVADKKNHTAYIVDVSRNEVVWRYDFRNDFPPSAGDHPVSGDWTHLNDIDVHPDAGTVLLSPRDFDRVILVNTSTKNVVWTLGQQDQHDVLYAQHNPSLLVRDPPTVLVADSENDRIVEYRRQGGPWKQMWRYEGGLSWPRDADRLPNGNTLIADTHNDRVIEVTPDGRIVWRHHIPRSPYDVERLQYGDEPTGPPMQVANPPKVVGPNPTETGLSKFARPYRVGFERVYQLVGAWIMPVWAGRFSFFALCFGLLLTLGWIGVELTTRAPISPTVPESSGTTRDLSIGVVVMAVGIATIPLLLAFGDQTAILALLGYTVFTIGFGSVIRGAKSEWSAGMYRILYAIKAVTVLAGIALSVLLLWRAAFPFRAERSHLFLLYGVTVVGVLSTLRGTHPRIVTSDASRKVRSIF